MTGESTLMLVSDSPNSLGRTRFEALVGTYPAMRAVHDSMGRPDMIYQDDLPDGRNFIVFFYRSREEMVGFTGGPFWYGETVGPQPFDPRSGNVEAQAFALFGARMP